MNKKAIGAVITTSLLIVVAVFAAVGFQNWFQTYFSDLQIDITEKVNNEEIQIKSLIGDILYIKSSYSENISVSKLEIGGITCINNQEIKPGFNELNINECLTNTTTGINQITLFTEDTITKRYGFIDSIPNCYSLSSGLIGLWHFDNNLNDNSGSNNHARDETGVTFNSSSKLGTNAAEFSGSNQHLNISNIDFSSGGSFNAWMKFDDLSTDRVLIGPDVGGKEEFQLWMDNGSPDRFAITIYDGGWQSLYGTTALSIDTWYFVGFIFNGTTAKLYVNGIQEGADLTRNILDNDLGDLWIGETTQALKDMNGLIDELAIYDRALTSSEMSQIYSENNLGKPICDN
jgi:hypothetical protein